MPKRIRSLPEDPKEAADRVLSRVIDSTEAPDPAIRRLMQEMGRKGGRIGGKRRLETMTPEERQESAAKAARKRWENNSKSKRDGESVAK